MNRLRWTRPATLALVAVAGFLAGRFSTGTPASAESAPQADELPKTRFHAMTSVHTIPGASNNRNLHFRELPDRHLPQGGSEGRFIDAISALPYLKNVNPVYERTDKGNRWSGEILCQFANLEEFSLRWMDRNETDWNPLARNSYHPRNHAYWKDHGVDFFLFPPPDPDDREAEFTWVITRHANGRLKMVTPFIGNVLRGEGRRHGIRLVYNETGGLVSMMPFVDGVAHGTALFFEGRDRSRRQAPKTKLEYVKGRRVFEKRATPLRRPGLPPKKK